MALNKNQNLVNIPKDVEDPFYRYKRPVLIAKVEGRGNGIKTVIVNMTEIAQSLARPPSYPTKFFGFELGAQTTTDQKNDKWIVNGKHDQSALEAILENFITKFVLCGTCRNPETTMTVLQSGNIDMRCKACGNTTRADSVSRLSSYIQKNPPAISAKEAKLNAKINAAKAQAENAAGGGVDGDASSLPKLEADDDDTWATDTSAEAVEKRKADLLGNTLAKTLVVGDETAEENGDARTAGMKELSEFVSSTPAPKVAETVKKIKEIAARESWKDTRLPQMIFASLFDNFKEIAKQVKARSKYLAPFVKDEQAQKLVLFCWESLCEVEESLISKSAIVLKGLYDADVLEEEVILKWNKHAAKKISAKTGEAVRAAAAKFVEWLQTAEEDDE